MPASGRRGAPDGAERTGARAGARTGGCVLRPASAHRHRVAAKSVSQLGRARDAAPEESARQEGGTLPTANSTLGRGNEGDQGEATGRRAH